MLMQRIRTGLAMAVPALLLILFAPPLFTELAIAVLILAGAWEWGALSGLSGRPARIAFVVVVAAALAAATVFAGRAAEALVTLLAASCAGWILATLAVLAAVVFAILDAVSPSMGVTARQGASFGIGANLVGFPRGL